MIAERSNRTATEAMQLSESTFDEAVTASQGCSWWASERIGAVVAAASQPRERR